MITEDDKILLTSQQCEELLENHPRWRIEGNVLVCCYRFTHFRAAMAFVTEAALLCEKQNHHARIVIDYHEVTPSLTSHDVGGLTARDVRLVAGLEMVNSRHGKV